MTDSYLLYRDSSNDGKKPYYSRRDVIKDLNLDIIFRTMAREDMLILEKVNKVMMIPLRTREEIIYRQEILQDFYSHPDMLEEMYECAVRQYTELQKFKQKREMNLTRSHSKAGEMIETLAYLTQGQEELIDLTKLLVRYEQRVLSRGLIGLVHRLKKEPQEEIGDKLNELKNFISGGEIGYSFKLGGGMKIDEIRLNYCAREKRRGPKPVQGTLKNFISNFKKNTMSTSNNAALKDDIHHLTESTMAHIMKMFHSYLEQMMLFYEHLAEEMAFYRGAVCFMQRMKELSIPLSVPVPCPPVDDRDGDRMGGENSDTDEIHVKGLYELSMAIYMQSRPVPNDLTLKGNILTLITGANQGGKSTFLRSYGIAQVLMQCGMPVPAEYFSAPVYHQIFTHFTRRESEKLDSGRLQEELKRMSDMVSAVVPNSLFLLNESFASTTEKEGSRIAGAILQAFYEKRVTTFMVTHLFQLANELYEKGQKGISFLTAERQEDGTRTFKMIAGKPSYTSYGTDLFAVLEREL